MVKTIVKVLKQKFLSKMLRMSRFISGIFSKLCTFSPHTKWPKHLKKFSNKIFFEKCLECWDLSMEFFWRYTYFRPTQNDQNTFETKLLSKYSDCRDLSLEFFCGYSCFTPYKMAKTLIKILKQKILTKMLRTSRFISRIFLRLCMFSPHIKWQNTCKNFETKDFNKNAQNIDIYQ